MNAVLAVGNVTFVNWLRCDDWGMSLILMPARLSGVYSSFRPKLRTTETGKSSPSAHAPFSAEMNVSLGGFVGVVVLVEGVEEDGAGCKDHALLC